MGFTKIEESDLTGKGVIGLPDRPGLSTAAMQAKLEETSRDVVIPKHNSLIDELEEETSATYLGATPVTGRASASTVQGVLDKLSTDLKTVEDGMEEAIQDAHTHANKSLLDAFEDDGTGLTYNGDPVGAVTSVNGETGAVSLTASDVGALPDTTPIPTNTSDLTNDSNFVADASYVHTDNNYDADAVSKKHDHSNKAVIDKFGEDSQGKPTYDGDPIGGGSGDAYKTIKVGTTTLTASEADTIEFVADDNIILTPDSTTTPKQIKIKSTGGGTGSASWGGISGTLSNQTDLQTALNAKADTSSLATVATTGAYSDLTGEPTKVSDLTNDAGYQTASDVATAISGKADTSSLGDLAYIDIDGQSSTKVLQGDGTWIAPPTGYEMIPNSTYISSLTAKSADATDDDVASGYAVSNWSNADIMTLVATMDAGDDSVGVWNDAWETDGIRTGWIWHKDLYHILQDNNVEIEILFDIKESEVVNLYAYRVDDEVQYTDPISGDTEWGGAIAIKTNGAIQAAHLDVAVNLKRQRTNKVNATIL